MNILTEGDNYLAPLNYENLLKKILQLLKTQNPFKFSLIDGIRLKIDVDKIAYQVAESNQVSPLLSGTGIRCATVNLNEQYRSDFPKQIRQIRDVLRNYLQAAQLENFNLEDLLAGLISNLESFQGTTDRKNIGFTYPFTDSPTLQKQRLRIQDNPQGSDSLLKLHKLTISVRDITEFKGQLKASLTNYIQQNFSQETEENLEDLEDTLEDFINNQKSEFYELIKLIFEDTEIVGKLKRTAKIRYLAFLAQNIQEFSPNEDGLIYLKDLIRRLKLIEKYLSDPEKDDAYYLVNYQGKQVNYRDLLARSDAFDRLPIIPLVDGYLGETTAPHKGEKKFIFGLKFKFDNVIHSQGEQSRSVWDYNLNLLDPESSEHRARLEDVNGGSAFKEKVLKIAFVYYFIFASRNNPSDENYNPNLELEYNPIESFDSRVLPILQGSDETKKTKLLKDIKKGLERFKVAVKITKLKNLLKKFLSNKRVLNGINYPLNISIKRGILESNIDRIINQRSFFKSVLSENKKDCLKYIDITDSQLDNNSFCHLSGNILIEDIRYLPTEEKQNFTMGYDLNEMKTLPIVIAPFEEQTSNQVYHESLKKKNLILISYSHDKLQKEIFKTPDSPKTFFYRFTYSLLIYLCLKVILEKVQIPDDKLFIPIMRLHLYNNQNPLPEEEFMRSLSKVLAHLLSEKYLSNSQGFCIKVESGKSFRIENSLSSLYSVLPKIFKLPDLPILDKLAIIIISSRESDRSWRGGVRISNLLGEVVGIEHLEDRKVRLQLIKTFSANLEHQEMFRNPSVVIDEVNQLYQKGFRHFMYIAKAPYSSTLNLTQDDNNESLFFLSQDVINRLKGEKTDIKIYPVFFDKYYVVHLGKLPMSLYIQDTLELTNLVEDPSKKSVVFFNLFNGRKVGNDTERFYRGVISYSTLLNIYPGILDDQDIRRGLIDDREDNPLKNDILQYLTLFHFSRYEKTKDISLKLDPYQNIIGDQAVSKLSLFPHTQKKIEFNTLAFLTEVRRAFNV